MLTPYNKAIYKDQSLNTSPPFSDQSSNPNVSIKPKNSKFDISSLISTLNSHGGAAPTNRFLVTITLPAGIGGSSDSEKISLFCMAAPLPGIALGTDNQSMPYGYGPIYKMPWGVIFNDIPLTFIGDSKGFVHSTFVKWIDSIVKFNASSVNKVINSQQPFFVSYRDDYVTNIKIQALDVNAQTFVTYTLYDAYPYVLDDISGSWEQQNSMMRIGVKFNFPRWTVEYENLSPEEFEEVSAVSQQVYSTAIEDHKDFTNNTRRTLISGLQQRLTNVLVNKASAKLNTSLGSTAFVNTINAYKDSIQYITTTDYTY